MKGWYRNLLTYPGQIVKSASTALLCKTICWLPVHWGKVYLSFWHSLMDCCFPCWTDLLSHLISHNMLLSDSQLFHVSMSLPLPRIPHAQPSSYSSSHYPPHPTHPLKERLLIFHNYSAWSSSQWKSSWPIPHSPLVELILRFAVWGLCSMRISVIASSLLWLLVGRWHSLYSELDQISNLKFLLTALAMQDNLLNQKLSAFYGRESERERNGWGGENGKMTSGLSFRINKNLFPSFSLCKFPVLSDVDKGPRVGKL